MKDKKQKPIIIAVVSGKGGVAKTTSTVNIATSIGGKGYRVLVGDIDKQSNTTKSFGAYAPKLPSIADVMVRKIDPRTVVRNTQVQGVEILPAAYDALELAPEEINLDLNRSRTNRLRCLEELSEYDFIFVDCPPSLELLTMNVLAVADYVVVPIMADAYGVEGLGHILKKIEVAREEWNPKLTMLGVFLTQDSNTIENKSVKEQMKETFGKKFFSATIRKSAKVAKASFDKTPLVIRYPYDNASLDYISLAQEVIEKCKQM